MKKTITTTTISLNVRLFWSLVLLLVFFVGAYIYFINSAILHIVARDRTQSEIKTLRTELLTIESSYYAIVNKLSIEDATSRGLITLSEKDTVFVALGADGKILTYRGGTTQ